MTKVLVSVLTSVFLMQMGFASDQSVRDVIKEAVIDYQIQKAKQDYPLQLLFPMSFQTNDDCDPAQPPPSNSSCVDAACKRMPSYLCDDHSDLRRVGAACAGVWDGTCIDTACDRLPSYLCDDHSDIESVASTCKSVSSSCLSAVCAKLPSYLCDDHSDMTRVGQICHGLYDGECIDAVCKRMPSYQCDDHSDLEQVARTCRGE